MLSVVATPIGNLYDLSYRQGKTLAEAEIILTEDTRSTGQLLIKIRELFDFEINNNQRLVSYYKEKEFEKLPEILAWLEAGKSVALISQAGTPVISDPGGLLLHTLNKRHIAYTVVPGPSAVTTALVRSGIPSTEFAFLGFFPKKGNEVKKALMRMLALKQLYPDMVAVFFESPNRIYKTLSMCEALLPDREIVVTRELTKLYEEVLRGTAQDLLKQTYKGELTVLFP